MDLNIVPQLSLDGPTSSSRQRCELAVVPPHLLRRPLAAWAATSWPARHHLLGLHRLPETPESLGPAPLMRAGYAAMRSGRKEASVWNMYRG